MSARDAEFVGRRLKVLGSPVRVRMIEALHFSGRELPVKEIAAAVGVTGEDASQHLAVLRREGVVVRRREGRQQLYSLASEEVIDIVERVARSMRPRGRPGAADPKFL